VCHNCRKYRIAQHPDLHFALPAAFAKPPRADDYEAWQRTFATLSNEWQKFFTTNRYPSLEQWYNHIRMENRQGIINAARAHDIVQTLNYKPYEASYKAVIMWHAELMNDSAANKLLKVIEEPSPHTIIILTTDKPEGMLRTILSRTQRVLLPPIADDAVAAALTARMRIDPDKAADIAAAAGGNYIQALELAAPSASNEDYAAKFAHLMRICMGNKPANVIALLLWAKGVHEAYGREQAKQFLMMCMRMLRDCFMLSQGIKDVPRSERIADIAALVHAANVEALYQEFNLALGQITANGHARMILTDLALRTIRHIRSK
jgi:DNA polymerase-3 subunit delta'